MHPGTLCPWIGDGTGCILIAWIETGSRPSEQTTAALARALRLTQAERDHLYALAGHTAPPRAFRTDHASPGLHAMHSRIHVATLRAVHGRAADDPEAHELVERLLSESDEFAALWERHEVASRAGTMKRFLHPLVGPLTLDCQVLTAENLTERLVVFTASPGSEDADRLALLAVVGSQAFSDGGA